MTPRKKKLSLREAIHEVMSPYEPDMTYPRLSLAVDLIVLFCILLSCTAILLEHLYPSFSSIFWKLEVVLTTIFVIEYLLRWYSAENRLKYPFTFFAVVDLLAIIPTFLMLGAELMLLRAFRGIRLLRLLRLFRLIRLLKVIRYGFLIYRGMVRLRTWALSLNYQYRLKQLATLAFWAVVAWFVGANVLYFTETHLVSRPGPFSDYWLSYWHILIVLVSGIEDKEPLSLLGRVEVTVLLIVGICVVGMLTGEIVAILVKTSQRAGRAAIKPPGGKLEQHVVILGRNSHLDSVMQQIHAATGGAHYILVVCPDAEEIRVTDKALYKRVFVLSGDPARVDTLDEAHIDKAIRVIILASERRDQPDHLLDGERLMQMLAVVGRRRQVPMVVELHDPSSERDASILGDVGVEFVQVRHYGEGLISQAVLNPGVTKIYDRLMSFSSDTNEFYTIPVPRGLVGRPFADAQLHYLDSDRDDIVVVGLDRSPELCPNTEFVLNPAAPESNCTEEDLILRADDRLIVLAFERPSFAAVEKEDLWSGRVLNRT